MPENRAKLRARAATPGCAILGKNADEVGVTVLDLSAEGACLVFRSNVAVPTKFLLRIGLERRAYAVEVRWHKGDRIGVAFLEPRDVPDVLEL